MLTSGELREVYECGLIESGAGSVTLTENQRDNKKALESVSLVFSGEVIKIHPSFFDKQKDVFRCYSGSKFRNYRKICDGVLLYHRGDGRNFLIVVELKSGFNDVKKACAQISASYVKLKMHLENFRSYEAADYEDLGLIFSFPPKDSDYNDSENNEVVMDAKMKMVGRKPSDPVEQYLDQCKKDLKIHGRTLLDASDMTVDRLPLKPSCLYTALPVVHQAVDNSTVSYKLDDILTRGY